MMTARRVPSYFITKKWVFDKAALRRERKALGILDRVKDFIANTTGPTIEDELTWYRVNDILNAACKEVAKEGDAAQKAAKERA